jgi:hypothetical protein
MRRNLQTAAPLLRELAAMGSPVSARQHPLALNEPPGPRRPAQRSPAPTLRRQVTAVVRYGNFELMGIVHPDDAPAVARMDAMTDGAERAAFLKAAAWTPAGQSAAGLLTQRQGCCLFLVLSTGTGAIRSKILFRCTTTWFPLVSTTALDLPMGRSTYDWISLRRLPQGRVQGLGWRAQAGAASRLHSTPPRFPLKLHGI